MADATEKTEKTSPSKKNAPAPLPAGQCRIVKTIPDGKGGVRSINQIVSDEIAASLVSAGKAKIVQPGGQTAS